MSPIINPANLGSAQLPDNQPSPDAPASPTPDNGPDAAPQAITLTPDQLDALGLTDCQDGESYKITIKKTGTSDSGAQFEIEDTEPGDDGAPGSDISADEPGSDMDGAPESPDESPAGEDVPGDARSETPEAPITGDEGGEPDSESKVLGYKRRKRPGKIGLPDTKKLRDI